VREYGDGGLLEPKGLKGRLKKLFRGTA